MGEDAEVAALTDTGSFWFTVGRGEGEVSCPVTALWLAIGAGTVSLEPPKIEASSLLVSFSMFSTKLNRLAKIEDWGVVVCAKETLKGSAMNTAIAITTPVLRRIWHHCTPGEDWLSARHRRWITKSATQLLTKSRLCVVNQIFSDASPRFSNRIFRWPQRFAAAAICPPLCRRHLLRAVDSRKS